MKNTNRKTKLLKVANCYHLFKELVNYYAANLLIEYATVNNFKSLEELRDSLPSKIFLFKWKNIGGQLIPEDEIETMYKQIKTGKN